MIDAKVFRRMVHHAPATAVFAVAAWESYWHTVEVATRYGETASAHVMPLSIDGVMVVAARFTKHARTRGGKALAACSFGAGVGAMLAMNVLAADPSPVARVIAALPALAMVSVAGMLHWTPQRMAPKRRRAPARKRPAQSRTSRRLEAAS